MSAAITKIDPNFSLPSAVNREGLTWYEVSEPPFSLYGVIPPEGPTEDYHRMPDEVAASVSGGVRELCHHTAGGRIRFSTDSDYIAVFCDTGAPMSAMPHMTFLGSQGFDLYRNEENGQSVFVGAFFPPIENLGQTTFSAICDHLPTDRVVSYTLNMPLYGRCRRLLIGLHAGAVLKAGVPYRAVKPFVTYGSSITQGACASRPGVCYQARLSHRFNLDYINLGFSGSAKAEPTMISYLSSLDPSLFVCDYDHNAPSLEHLKETLPPLYHAVRAAHPDLPFLFMSAPGECNGAKRRDFIKETYEKALAEGDRHVMFLDGYTVFAGEGADTCTIEGCHPNDLGFYRMYLGLVPFFEKLYG